MTYSNDDILSLFSEKEKNISNFKYISDRLLAIRRELKKESKLFSTENISLAIGSTKSSLYRLERNEHSVGYIDFLNLINFYARLGYNIQWILLKDNSSIPKFI